MGKWRYGVILDAGSSGTRVHVYRWLNNVHARKKATEADLRSLPELVTQKKWTKKTHPGVSTFNKQPERVGPDHLEPLLRHALDIVPKHAVSETPIFLLATAGMRLLPEVQKDELLQRICSYVRLNSAFLLPDCGLHVQVIPGETEGIYGWLAANYLLGAFDAAEGHRHGNGHHTYGFLDMGGASAQIAFAPNATEAEKHADDLQLVRLRTLNGESKEYGVFVTTWLGFGVHQARRRYVEALLEASATHDARELPDPCLPVDLLATTDGDPLEPGSEEAKRHKPYLVGTGRFDECLRQTSPLLDKDAPCEDRPCLLHGVHVPAIDFDVNHFVGVSEYWHTTHEVFEMAHKDKAYDFNTYQKRVKEFCSQDWKTITAGVKHKEWGKKVDEHTAVEVCFKASWMINVLHDGIGIPRVGLESTKTAGHNGTQELIQHAKAKAYLDPFQAVDKIRDVEVSWTLGKMVLYAASQIPSETDLLPVGFGSNTVPVPSDFQYAGSRHAPDVNATAGADDDEADGWSQSILDSDSPRRIPGFLLFLVIVGIIGLIWCRKDRRARWYRRLTGSFGRRGGHKRRRVLGGKLFGGAAPAVYERVLEDADGQPDIELGGDSDNELSGSSGNSHVGRTSGWATPQLSVTLEHATHTSYFDHHVPATNGVGLGIGLAGGAGSGGGEQGGGGGASGGGGGGVGGHPQPHHHHYNHHHHHFASSAMTRSGLVGRTESRDRLFSAHAGTGGSAFGPAGSIPSTSNLGLSLGLAGGSGSHPGRRSRATSPVRHKTPLMTPFADEFD